MAYSQYQQTTASVSSTASAATMSPGTAFTSGNTAILFINTSNTATTVASITDTAGNSWLNAVNNQARSTDVEIWYAIGLAAGTPTITINWSGGASGQYAGMLLTEWSGITAFNQNGTNSGTGTSHTGAAVAASAGDIVFSIEVPDTSTNTLYTQGPTGGWSNLYLATVNTNRLQVCSYLITGAAGTFNTAYTVSTSLTYNAVGASFHGSVQSGNDYSSLNQTPQLFQGTSSSSSASLAMTTNPSAGDFLVACLGTEYNSSSATVSGITDTQGNTWVLAKSSNNSSTGTSDRYSSIWYCAAAKGGGSSNTLTVAFNASTVIYAALVYDFALSGATISALDQTASAATSAANPATGTTSTTAVAAELVIGAISTTLGTTNYPTAVTLGYNALQPLNSVNVVGLLSGWEEVAATGTYGITWTQGGLAAYAGCVATFELTASVTVPHGIIYRPSRKHFPVPSPVKAKLSHHPREAVTVVGTVRKQVKTRKKFQAPLQRKQRYNNVMPPRALWRVPVQTQTRPKPKSAAKPRRSAARRRWFIGRIPQTITKRVKSIRYTFHRTVAGFRLRTTPTLLNENLVFPRGRLTIQRRKARQRQRRQMRRGNAALFLRARAIRALRRQQAKAERRTANIHPRTLITTVTSNARHLTKGLRFAVKVTYRKIANVRPRTTPTLLNENMVFPRGRMRKRQIAKSQPRRVRRRPSQAAVFARAKAIRTVRRQRLAVSHQRKARRIRFAFFVRARETSRRGRPQARIVLRHLVVHRVLYQPVIVLANARHQVKRAYHAPRVKQFRFGMTRLIRAVISAPGNALDAIVNWRERGGY